MIGEAKNCPREVFFWKTLSCTDVCNQSERENESAPQSLEQDASHPETSNQTVRMVTEALQTGKPDATPWKRRQASGNRLTSRFPQSSNSFCRNWHFLPAGGAANLSRTAETGGTLHSGR